MSDCLIHCTLFAIILEGEKKVYICEKPRTYPLALPRLPPLHSRGQIHEFSQEPKKLEDLTGLTELMRNAAECILESDDEAADSNDDDFVEL